MLRSKAIKYLWPTEAEGTQSSVLHWPEAGNLCSAIISYTHDFSILSHFPRENQSNQ